jgi:hypothetical protein
LASAISLIVASTIFGKSCYNQGIQEGRKIENQYELQKQEDQYSQDMAEDLTRARRLSEIREKRIPDYSNK